MTILERERTSFAANPGLLPSAPAPDGESQARTTPAPTFIAPGDSPSTEAGEVPVDTETHSVVAPATSADDRAGEVHRNSASQVTIDLTALRLAAEMYFDFQQMRIAAENRAKRGGIDPSFFADQLAAMAAQEKDLAKLLVHEYRRAVPALIRRWQAETLGLGEHTFARLLGILGHPRHATPYRWVGTEKNRHLVADPPFERSIGQLWSYCGVGDPTRKRRAGMTAEEAMAAGSPRLRALLFVISESSMKNRLSPYRKVYDEARTIYEEREDWKPAHRHAAALRKVAKEILRDLWVVAGT